MNPYENLIEQQRLYFNTNATKALDFRIKQLKQLYQVIKNNESLLGKAIYQDFKKSKFDTFTNELALLYLDIKEAIKKLDSWAKIKRVKTNIINLPAKSYIIPEPYGVCLIIGAWNYPYQLSLAPVIAAIAAGNTVMLKPSELSANSSHAMAEIINKSFDANFFNVIEGGVAETTQLLENKFDKIFFTGSVPVGKIVYQAAAKQLTPVTLELGGKSPAIILQDAKLDITVKRLVWAKFLNAGQTCIAPDYILVHKSIEKQFLEKVVEEIKRSHFSFDNGNYVQIINERNFNRLINLISPDKIFYGGKSDVSERYIEPTVLFNIGFEDNVMNDEIFGPLLPVITFDNPENIILEIKKRPKPLSCYVFTQNKTLKKKILYELSFGGGAVNDAIMHISNSHLPFGGVGNSGIGSYHGEAGFRTFSHFKSILEKSTWMEPNLKYFPHSEKKLAWIRKMMRL
jgi:aldehyde dehydrogenase (NAD+)